VVEKTEFEYNLDLLKKFNENLILEFQKPLLNLNPIKKNFIIFHAGFGGSSDGNLILDDYLKLAKKASLITEIVFTFGPDDDKSKEYIKEHINFDATIRDDFKSLWDFTKFISTTKLFISTSTGPMHLAGLTNTKTLSFFGENLFASSKRWATTSDTKMQNNYEVKKNYTKKFYSKIENKLIEILDLV
jgi:ADP-heptose:LPS heptosyltransferase